MVHMAWKCHTQHNRMLCTQKNYAPRNPQANFVHHPNPTYAEHHHNNNNDQNNELQELQFRLASIEAALMQPRDPDNNGKTPFILDSGANPTHVAHPHPMMKQTNT